jgi:hypothetical protein
MTKTERWSHTGLRSQKQLGQTDHAVIGNLRKRVQRATVKSERRGEKRSNARSSTEGPTGACTTTAADEHMQNESMRNTHKVLPGGDTGSTTGQRAQHRSRSWGVAAGTGEFREEVAWFLCTTSSPRLVEGSLAGAQRATATAEQAFTKLPMEFALREMQVL